MPNTPVGTATRKRSFAEKMEDYGEKIKAHVDVMVAYAQRHGPSGAGATAAAAPVRTKAVAAAAALPAAAEAPKVKAKAPTTCPGGPALYNLFIKEVNDRIVEKRGNGKQVKYQPLKMRAGKFWSATKAGACKEGGGEEYVRAQAKRAADLILRGYSSYDKTTPKAPLIETNFETRKVKKMPATGLATVAPLAVAAAANNRNAGGAAAAAEEPAFVNNLAGLAAPGEKSKRLKSKKTKKVRVKSPNANLNEAAALAALAEVEAGVPALSPAAAAAEAPARSGRLASRANALAEAENSPNRRGNLAAATGSTVALGEEAGRAALEEAVAAGRARTPNAAARSPNVANLGLGSLTPSSPAAAAGNGNSNASNYGYTNLGNYNANTGLRRIRAANGEEYFMNDEHRIYNNNMANRGQLKPGGNINYV